MNISDNWLGLLPEDWKVARFNSLYQLRNEKVSDKDYPALSVTKKGIVPQLENAAKTNDGDNRKLVKISDFAINSRSDRRGSCGISKYNGSVSLINTVLSPIDNVMNPQYYDWLFHTVQFGDEFYKWGHGIVDDLWTTNWQDMKNIVLPLPSSQEQEKIAKYLNQKCSKIDNLLNNLQQEIEKLEKYRNSVISETITKGLDKNVPMKNSGIKWLGKIPSNWKLERIKFLTSLRNEKSLLSDINYKYIGLENIEKYTGKIIETKTDYEDAYYDFCKQGDLLFSKLSPNLSKATIAPYDSCCTGEFVVIKDSNIEKRFLLYYLLSTNINEVTTAATYGTKMPRINWEFLGNLKIAFPVEKEQRKIINYLDEKCKQIDQIIKNKKELLNTIDKYKQSLIYEYVTGKKRVPDIGEN